MKSNWIWLVLALLVIGLAACGGVEIASEPTATAVPNLTLVPQSTETAVPTETPLPTDTPAPTATATITPTPEPQVGDLRIDPESGEEQVFTEAGEWTLKAHVWDLAEQGKLPANITKENGRFELHEDGSATLLFTLDNPESLEHGRLFGYDIPAFGETELMDLLGDIVPVSFDGAVYQNRDMRPSAKMSDVSGNRLAVFDWEQEHWRPIYTNLKTGLGQQELEDWMPEELGLLVNSTREVYFNGMKHYTRDFSVMCKPVRLFEWQMVNGKNELTKIATMMEVACNEEDSGNIFVPIWDSSGSDWDSVRIWEYNSETGAEEQTPSSHREKSYDEMLALPTISPGVTLWLIIFDEELAHVNRPGSGDWTKPLNSSSPGSLWWRSAMARRENYNKQIKWADEVLETGISDQEGVVFGVDRLNFLTASGEQ